MSRTQSQDLAGSASRASVQQDTLTGAAPTAGTLTFAAGQTLKTVSIPIWPDAASDANETFTIVLSWLTGAGVTLIGSTATGTTFSLS